MPLRPVEDAEHLLAGIRHLLLDPRLVGVQIHQTALEAEPPRAEEALVDPRGAEHVRAEVADERHRRQPERAAGDEHGDARRVGERGGDQQPVRHDDELPLGAELEREVVGGGARIERDRLALVDERGRGTGDRLLAVGLDPQAQVERELCLAALKGAHAAPDPCHEALARQLREVAADGHFRNRKRLRKFRNRKRITGLEQAEHLLHPFVLRQVRQLWRHFSTVSPVAGSDRATLRRLCCTCQWRLFTFD